MTVPSEDYCAFSSEEPARILMKSTGSTCLCKGCASKILVLTSIQCVFYSESELGLRIVNKWKEGPGYYSEYQKLCRKSMGTGVDRAGLEANI